VCQYLPINKNIVTLEILDNKVTSLGCEFLGKILMPKMGTQLTVLKLDHNPFGSKGLNHLAKGIRMNKELLILSLTYCNIDATGARALFEILIYTQSKLEEVLLGGNALKDNGTQLVLRGTSIAKSLKRISLSDNQFNDTKETM
jgi:Ran GTPase-activating protein (RanGAP) involved in mRNA processing and transport